MFSAIVHARVREGERRIGERGRGKEERGSMEMGMKAGRETERQRGRERRNEVITVSCADLVNSLRNYPVLG